jgi:hypothetical protein
MSLLVLFSKAHHKENVNHPRKLTLIYQELSTIAISRSFHSVGKGVMRKVEEKGGQVVSGLTKNRVEQNTIRLPLPPTYA